METRNLNISEISCQNTNFNSDVTKKYQRKRKRKKDFDFEINVNDGTTKIPVHKEVLEKRCRYFGSMLRHNFNETSSNSVSFPDKTCSETVPDILDYLYSGTIKLTNLNAFGICYTARYLGLEELEKTCMRFIRDSVSIKTINTVRSRAEECIISELLDYTKQFIEMNFEDFIKHRTMKEWTHQFLLELLRSDDIRVKSETKVVQLLTNWLSSDFPSRKTHMDELISKIRFSHLTTDKIVKSVGDGVCLKILQCFTKHMDNCLLNKIKHRPRLFHKGVYYFGKLRSERDNDGDSDDPFPFGRWWPKDRSFTRLKSPSVRRQYCDSAVLNDRVYLVGGLVNNEHLNSVEVYDPTTDTWSFTAPMNSKRSHHCCCSYKGKLFVFGGESGSSEKLVQVEVYTPEEDRWDVLPEKHEHSCQSRAAVIGDFIYVVQESSSGGERDDKYYSIRRFQPSTTLWTDVKPDNCVRLKKTMFDIYLAAHGSKLLLFKRRKQVLMYDTATETFDEGHLVNDDNSIEIGNAGKIFVFHGLIYLSQGSRSLSRGRRRINFAVLDPKVLDSSDQRKKQMREMYQYSTSFESCIDMVEAYTSNS